MLPKYLWKDLYFACHILDAYYVQDTLHGLFLNTETTLYYYPYFTEEKNEVKSG